MPNRQPLRKAATRPRVVIIVAGFGGLSVAKDLAGAPFDVALIDRHNYHLFQPLLYQLLKAREQGKEVPPFTYRDFGSLSTIGRKSAVAQFGSVKVTGFPAWVLWSVAHIYFLIGFRSRLSVGMNWAWNYVTFQRGTRLITELSGSRVEDMPMPAPQPAAPPAAQLVRSVM
jgi:NADH dehydrogenase FAD-containing subunit